MRDLLSGEAGICGNLDAALMRGATICSALDAGLVDARTMHLAPVVLSAASLLFTGRASRTPVQWSES